MAEQRYTRDPGNVAEGREKASHAGHVGGRHSHGNFVNHRERVVKAGRNGGDNTLGGGELNPGNVAQEQRASEADRKGGQ